MRHMRTHYRDIVQDDDGQWITVRGSECEVCGANWPCEKAGHEAAAEDWL